MNTKTLTEIERQSLEQTFNFADGHAYQDLDPCQQIIIHDAALLWQEANSLSKQDAETLYLRQFCKLSGSGCLTNYPNFVFCPTASNSIDLVGAWLASQYKSVALIEPTFDNLALLLKRRKIPLVPIKEEDFHLGDIEHLLLQQPVDGIFLVNPNNPTGRTLSFAQWHSIIDVCKQHNKTLIIDCTFRFFVDWDFCLYQLLLNSGVTFICIEDSGKVFPTLEMKCSMVVYSDDIAQEMKTIYEEFYLQHSNFILLLLAKFMQDAADRSLSNTLYPLIDARRSAFRNAIADSIIEIAPSAMSSRLSIEWCRIKESRLTGSEFATLLTKYNVGALPGEYFYWHGRQSSDCHVRFALLKPSHQFGKGLEILSEVLEDLTCTY